MKTVQFDVTSAEQASRVELFVRIVWLIISFPVLYVFTLVASTCVGIEWLLILITGKRNMSLNNVIKMFYAYTIGLYSYMFLLTDERNPIIPSNKGMQTVKFDVTSAEQASRLELIIRFLWLFPTSISVAILGITLYICLPLEWILILILGKRIMFLNGIIKKFINYTIQIYSYLNLLTDERNPIIPS